MVIAVLAVLAGVFFAATGRGGELAYEHTDHTPLDLGPVSAADVAMLRPPTALLGYNVQVTNQALDHIARAIRDRDVTIAYLRQQLEDLASRNPAGLALPLAAEIPAEQERTQPAHPAEAAEPAEAHQVPAEATEPSQALPAPEEAPAPEARAWPETQGPQGSYDTHDWWAEQEKAAREEAEEQGW
jgi:hypothetical protein